METIFDRLVAVSSLETRAEKEPEGAAAPQGEPVTGQYTARDVKAATQELLKHGLVESDKKPNLYRTALARREIINGILEPLDLRLHIDDVRGLAFIMVAESNFDSEDDEWSHPLIRRQRLTLEQSLLVAILRQRYVLHEQEAGIGTAAVVAIDELLPQLQIYLGETGSDLRDQKRLRTLLEALKSHGIVSEIDERDQITIRPIITHVANPESLHNLLQHLRAQAGGGVAGPHAADDEESAA